MIDEKKLEVGRMEELKTCPFCGKKIDIGKNVYIPERGWHPSYYDPDSGGGPIKVTCECGLEFYSHTWEWEKFVEKWNRRVKDD